MLLLGFLSLALIIVGFWYWSWFYYTKDLRGIRGPKYVPVLGSALDFIGVDSTAFLSKPLDYIKTYGDVVKAMMGFRFYVLISDCKMTEFFLSNVKYIDKSDMYTFLQRWLGTGLLTSTGEKWRKRRKIITPTYHFKILEQFIDVFDANSDILASKFEKEVGKGATDVYPFVTLCALDNICESVMGTSVNAQIAENSEYVQSVKSMCKLVAGRAFDAFEQYDFIYKFLPKYRQEKKLLKIMHGHTSAVITSRRRALAEEPPKEDGSCEFGEKKRTAFLDLLLQSTIDGKPLSDEDIREEVDTFMFEGHDTTASAITFVLYCIANNPKVQEKVVVEQRDIFADDPGRAATYKDFTEMKYLELVIKETLRLYPSVPFFGRYLQQDCHYGDGVVLKKGSQLLFCVYALMRNEKYFPNPEEFIPERFENPETKLPYAYVPFSAGPRNCIGQKFAMLEMKSTVSKVVRRFELSPVVPEHKLHLAPETILKSTNGVLVNIKKRYW